jgi:cystathionine beta-lyase
MTQSTAYDFDTVPDRRHSDSAKWNYYAEGTLPLWVADMDFRSPQPILDALHARVDHGFFGYGMEPVQLRDLIVARMDSLYHWHITPEQIVFLPGLVCGLNVTARAVGAPGDGVMVNTPVYPPFLSAPTNQERALHNAPLARTHRHDAQGKPYLYYEMDFDAMQAAVQPNTAMFTLCNPHNPVGRAYSRAELEQLAEFCLRHDLTICADEIHSDLTLDGTHHLPIAALSPEIADRTITLLAPSKTFNIPGLGCSLAIVPNPNLRQQVIKAMTGLIPHVNLLGFAAAIAAYESCEEWLQQLRAYLTANRDFTTAFVREQMPQVELTLPEATYLGWLDFRAYGLNDPYQHFLDHAKVSLSSGKPFGAGGETFVRLNFGCPRATLTQALTQMAAALPA